MKKGFESALFFDVINTASNVEEKFEIPKTIIELLKIKKPL
jgi:hypothetical protein